KWAAPSLPGAQVLAAALDRKVEERPGMRDVVAAMRGATTILPIEVLAATAVMETSVDGTEVLEADGEGFLDFEESAEEDLDGESPSDAAAGEGDSDEGWQTVDFDGRVFDDMVLPGRETLEGEPELAMKRPALIAAWAVAVAAVAAVAPFAAAAVVIVAALVARTVFRRAEALRIARARRGERRGDSVLQTLGVPWHLLRATTELLPSLLIAAPIGAGVGALGWYLVSIRAVATGTADGQVWGHAIAIAVGALAFQAALWWGLWSWTTREGSYKVAESLAPTTGVSGAWIVVAVIVFCSAALAVYLGADTWWWPLPAMPQSGG
ncbi:MAG: hypothetical protein HGA51_10525, partial [Demequinaceae bacterium]|nr:hypothetical protein [Demequinaceae bacterium]